MCDQHTADDHLPEEDPDTAGFPGVDDIRFADVDDSTAKRDRDAMDQFIRDWGL